MITVEKKAVRAGKFVNTKHVDTLIKNYKQKRWVQNSKRLGKEDSLSVWFSIEDIEAFLEKAKEHGADGVRYYFGVYDDQFAEQPLFAGRQTLVMVATRQKENEDGVVKDKDIYYNNGRGTNIMGFNMGRICPPFCATEENGIGIGIVDKGEEGLVVA